MSKRELLDALLKANNGVLKTSDAVEAGVSKPYFLEYVRNAKLEKTSQGIYIAEDAWNDEMFLLQARFPQAIFSHETALYILDMANREPLQFTVTVKRGYHNDNLAAQGVKAYFVKRELYETGVVKVQSPNRHELRTYNAERTICDLIRSRSNVEIQDLQTAMKEYVRRKDKNLPLLMRYAKLFRVEKNPASVFGGIVTMIRTSRQLKALVRNISRGNSTQAQIIIRNYIMERFLERISLSEYRDNFILKGGMLVSAMVGLDTRSTMDIDATVKNLPLTVETARETIEKIISVSIDDGVIFTIKNVTSIMGEVEYGGIQASLEAEIDTMKTPLKVDISTGDVITPQEVAYQFKLMFEERTISVWAYNLETVLSEKLETVISRGTANTRLRDFYDLYVLQKDDFHTIDMDTFPKAFEATCLKRQSTPIVSDGVQILHEIRSSEIMMQLWHNYQKKYNYAENITWDEVMEAVYQLFVATRQE